VILEPLKNLEKLKGGINKRWIWKDTEAFNRSRDYLQKIGYSIQDINGELEYLAAPSMKDVVFVIVLIDWIREAVKALPALIRDDLIKGFVFLKQDELDRAEKYFIALRSFVVAHPLSTDRHKPLGLDGSQICVDVGGNTTGIMSLIKEDEWKHFDLSGMHNGKGNGCADIVLKIYDKEKYDMRFFVFVKVNSADMFYVATLLIEKLYALDKYLAGLKMREWV